MSRGILWRLTGIGCLWFSKIGGGLLSLIITHFFVTEKTNNDGPPIPETNKKQNDIRLFVLHEDLFRGDLEELARHERVAIYCLDVRVQFVLKKMFYGKTIDTIVYYQKLRYAQACEEIVASRNLLRSIFPKMLDKMQISTIVTANVRYLEDLDWCAVGEEQNVPWFVLYREGLLMFPRAVIGSQRRHESFGKFFGTHIGVQNETVRKMLVDSRFAAVDQVTVCGAPRAERLKRLLNGMRTSESIRKRVLVLYFAPGRYQHMQIDDFGERPPGVPLALFVEVMRGIVELAVDYPQTDFLIKPKKGDSSIAMFTTLVSDMGYQLREINNLIINGEIDIHDAILGSDVVCGLQTTAVLEAAICKKPVILPFFKNYRNSEWSERFGYRRYLELFLVPADVSELTEMIMSSLDTYVSEASVIEARKNVFSEWISPIDEDAVQVTVDLLSGVGKSDAPYCDQF